jgi:hypothetical protein
VQTGLITIAIFAKLPTNAVVSTEIRTLCSEIRVIAKGRLVHTGPTREMGGDIDAFEERPRC